jgi:hypothetical protein
VSKKATGRNQGGTILVYVVLSHLRKPEIIPSSVIQKATF